jgi:Reverse transcriptase (RNA-dependent DNA polymerase)
MHTYLANKTGQIPKPIIENEIDPEDWKNHTVNLIEELDNEQIGNAVLLSYIEEVKLKVWINAKTGIAIELAIKKNKKKADLPVEKLISEDLHKFLDVFNDNNANWFPESNVWDHKIDIKKSFRPKSFKNYNLTLEEQKELDKFLGENLENGYIQLSQSPQASPFFFVKKKDGRLQPCQDYRYLNDWTVKNTYPLPLILEIMNKLKGAKYFSKFDVQWGYNNVWIQSEDEWKAAFKTNQGLYEPTVMFFRMCNSPVTFQAMMDEIFKKKNWRGPDYYLYGQHSGIFQNNWWPQENWTDNIGKSTRIWSIFQSQEMWIQRTENQISQTGC